MKITRVAPALNSVEINVDKVQPYKCYIKKLGKREIVEVPYKVIGEKTLLVENLDNDIDYAIFFLELNDCSNTRFFRCGDYEGIVVNYIHPDDMTYHPSGMCPCSPSIVELDNGRLLVSHDIYYHDMKQNISIILSSDDRGKSWQYLSSLTPCFWGKLFIHKNTLYMLGHNGEYGDLLLFKSDDFGINFNKPIILIKGGSKVVGGPHKAPMPVVTHQNRLWTAIDYGSWHTGGHASGVISIDVDSDLSKKENWVSSQFLPYNPKWEGVTVEDKSGLLEGNVVVKKDGSLVNFLRYSTGLDYSDYGKAIYLNIDSKNPSNALTFGKVVPFNGNTSKFTIKYDQKTDKYWTIVSRADQESVKKRNKLVLMSSLDLDLWVDEKVLIDYSDYIEDYTALGFQYVDFIFSQNKILYASRTAINGALSYHDSNCITFHETDYS